jgi:hypothetical protein
LKAPPWSGFVHYDHCQDKKEEQSRMADMAGDENVYDLLRMTGMAIHVNDKQGLLFKINEAGSALGTRWRRSTSAPGA